MKITTWNVNGIRSVLRKGLMTWIQFIHSDVLCLQEVKARPDQLGKDQEGFQAYNCVWNPAIKPGYSGVATIMISPPEDIQVGIGEHRFDAE